MKIYSIVGARPQFIKAAMLCRELAKEKHVCHELIHTGQHFDSNMSEIFFSELQIPPPLVNFNINEGGHGKMTGSMLIEIERLLIRERPDLVVVFGDTNSTLAGALAASKLNIPVCHVEAGLRSYNRTMPEEINRILTDDMSDILFAPSKTALENLHKEAKNPESIHFSGDIMFDASLVATCGIESSQVLGKYDLKDKEYVLTTIHRAENTDDCERLESWLTALNILGGHIAVLFPVHPRTFKALQEAGKSTKEYPNIRFIDPIGYRDMAVLTRNARLVATDSGGLQKEAYFHKVPGVVFRNETEWCELVKSGWSRLVSQSEASDFVDICMNFAKPTEWKEELFGNGHAAQIIREIIIAESA